jgi:peptidoglycan/xylan/chitin deacetylase (PgdA/CDA1 family)
LEKVWVEFGLSDSSCKFGLQDVYGSKNLDLALQPKLPLIKTYETQYVQKKSDYDLKTAEYQKILQIMQVLELPVDPQDKVLDKIPESQNGIQEAITQMQEYIVKAQIQIQEFKDSQLPSLKILNNKIKEARDSGLDVTIYESQSNLLLQSKVDNVAAAQGYKQNLDNLPLSIQAINNQLAQIPEYEKKYIVNFPILMYHRIEDFTALPVTQQNKTRQDLTTSPQAFAMQLDLLQSKGYQTVTMEEVSQAVLYKDAEFFNRKLVMLTFDDGYAEHYKIVFPELKKRGMKGVFGIVTNYKGMTWDELREMSRDPNMEIVSHTVSHCPLGSATSFFDLTPNPWGGEYRQCSNTKFGNKLAGFMPSEEVRFELQESKNILEKELVKPVKYLIYPYGSFNQQTIDIAKEVGYQIGLKVGSGLNVNLNDFMALGRVNVSGLHEPLGGWFAGI